MLPNRTLRAASILKLTKTTVHFTTYLFTVMELAQLFHVVSYEEKYFQEEIYSEHSLYLVLKQTYRGRR